MPTQPYYNKEKKRLPSTTTVIGENLGWNKRILMAWQAKEFKAGRDPTLIKEHAATIGDAIHAYISSHVTGVKIPDEEMSKYTTDALVYATRGLEQFKTVCKKENIELIASELPLVSEKYQYGGTLDLRAVKAGKRALPDIKSSNGIYEDYIIQLGAYDNLLIENEIDDPEEYFIIKVSKDPKAVEEELITLVPISKDMVKLGFEVFKQLRWIHDIKKEFKI